MHEGLVRPLLGWNSVEPGRAAELLEWASWVVSETPTEAAEAVDYALVRLAIRQQPDGRAKLDAYTQAEIERELSQC